ncbi:MAG TPA: DNA topoisomerase, partial [Desulfurivibrionaceae bacterium]|nr:DNA topoisomerase [Desulfurivibrionaceae bacterium]
MAKDVIIVESEQKARTIAAQLAAEVETVVVRNAPVKATLLPPKDPLKREPPKFSFVLVDGGQEFFAKLSQAAGATLYLAFDSDQRGEYWAWLINEYLLGQTVGVQGVRRLHLLGLGREDLRESFRLVEPVDSDKAVGYHLRMLFNAHLAHHLKRLIGTATGPQGLPLNSETLATLFLLAERESEIRAFTPPLKWQVRVRLAAEDGEFDARLVEAYGITDDGYVRDALQSKEMVGLFRGKPFLVGEVAEEELRIEPPAPFRLMELLQEAYLAHRLMPAQVLSAVRELYEGVDVASGTVGLVSAFVPFENADTNLARARIRAQVEKRFGPAMLAAEEQEVDLKGTLLPLRPEILPADLAGTVGTVTHQVYALIHARALASQMRDAEGILRDVVFQAGESCLFRASGRVVREQGFLAAYQGQQFRELLAPSPLGNLQEGQEVRNVQIVPEQTAGFPPEYYTFEGLAGDLADFALAPDASAIGMLQRMLDGGYLALMPDGTWRCRENATTLISVMNKAFPTMKGVNLSAYFEQTVTEAATNRKPLAFAIQQFDQTMMMQGNVLVKIKMPVAPRPRVKTSRSIIKTAGVEAPPPAAAPTEEALVPPPAGVPSGEEAPVAVTPVPVVEEA